MLPIYLIINILHILRFTEIEMEKNCLLEQNSKNFKVLIENTFVTRCQYESQMERSRTTCFFKKINDQRKVSTSSS